MRRLDIAHKILGSMGSLIAIFTFAGRFAPAIQLPARSSELLLSALVLVLAAFSFYRRHEPKAEKPVQLGAVRWTSINQEASTALLLPNDLAIPIKTKAELESVTFAQRFALQLIYENPGIFYALLCQRLYDLGFRETGELIVQPLTKTSLVHLDGRSNLSPSTDRGIAKAVQEFIDRRPS